MGNRTPIWPNTALVAALIDRQTPEPVARYVKSLRLERATGPISVPGLEEHLVFSRLVYPLQAGSWPLGYLSLINEPPVDDQTLQIIEDALPDIIETLANSRSDMETFLGKAVQLANEALTNKSPESLIQAFELGLVPSQNLAVARCRVHDAHDQPASTSTLHRLIEDLAATTYPGRFICTVNAGALVAFIDQTDKPGTPLCFDTALHSSTNRMKLKVASIGTCNIERNQWAGVIEANENAKLAHRLANSTESNFVEWEELGIWKILLSYDFEADAVQHLSKPAARLIHDEPTLAETLWVYFHSGRNIMESCKKLHIHRATLYYRLKRIKEVAGDSILTDGTTALSAHLALMYWMQLAQT